MKKILIPAIAALALTPLAAQAQDPEQRAEFGTLECVVEGGVGFVIGSSKEVNCTFAPADGRPSEDFYGVINKYGLDVGVTGDAIMEWVVLAPTGATYSAEALAGDYVGASAEASAGLGGGANVLVGGDDDSFALQPVSVQAQTGVNLALGVSEFQIRSVN